MKIIEEIKKEQWNNFVAEQKQSQFLQSWEWGELAQKESGKIWRVGIEENGKLIATATLIKKKVLGFNYWFCPRGPIVSYEVESYKVIKFLFEEIKRISKKEGGVFLRYEPQVLIHDSLFLIQKTISIEPNKTSIIDLNKTEDELLSSMHQKTRYNIHLAEKKGVEIREGNSEDFESFWRIMKETVTRDGFRLHGKEHYQQILDLNKDFVRLFLAEYNGEVVAAVLSVFFGDMITYVHGASANKYRNVMAPYLLHWHIMKLGKSAGYKYYDLNGVDEKKWPGVTRFKMGFGGEIVEYPGTYDLVFNQTWYNVYKTLRIIRRRGQ